MAEFAGVEKKQKSKGRSTTDSLNLAYAKLCVRLFTSDRLAVYRKLMALVRNRFSLMDASKKCSPFLRFACFVMYCVARVTMSMKSMPGMVMPGNIIMEAAAKMKMTIISARSCIKGRRLIAPCLFPFIAAEHLF